MRCAARASTRRFRATSCRAACVPRWWQSLWRILCARDLQAHVTVLSAEGSRHADRRALAEHLRSVIGEALAQATIAPPGPPP
jgi:hypothetical protein